MLLFLKRFFCISNKSNDTHKSDALESLQVQIFQFQCTSKWEIYKTEYKTRRNNISLGVSNRNIVYEIIIGIVNENIQ